MNTSKHHAMTNELYTEVLEIYKTLSEPFHFENFPASFTVLGTHNLFIYNKCIHE